MPISTEEIVIDIEGQVDDMIKDSNRVIQQLDEIKKATKAAGEASIKQGKGIEAANQGSTGAITDFNSALSLARQGMQYAGMAYEATAGKTIAYANEVRKLSQVSGASAEDTSRLIQVLDDYKISADQALASTRFLTKNGHTATLETLGKLSDEYLKLNSQQEKNAFAQKNLGRGYIAYISILEKGSAAIKAQGDAVADNLILSQKVVDDARKQEIALDSLNDSWDGLMMTIGKVAIPIAIDAANGFNVLIRAAEILKEKNFSARFSVTSLGDAMDQAGAQIWQEQQALSANKEAAEGAAEGTDELADSQKEAEDAAKSLTSVYQGLLSSMFTIQDANEKLSSDLQAADEKEAELTQKKAEALGEYLRKKQEIDSSNESGAKKQQENTAATVEYAKALQALDKDLADNAQSKVDAQKELEDAGKKRVYDLTQQKLAADGVVSTGEYEYLQQLAVSMGLVTQAAADQAIAENQRADALVAAFGKIESPMQRDLALMQQINSYNGTTVQFGVNYQSNMPTGGNTYGTNGINYSQSFMPGQSKPMTVPKGSRDSGGSGVAGTPYMIGTGAQPEMFIPSSNGTFVPNADKMGATYNITINNPKKETAENSIRSALKKMSYSGVAA